MKKFLKSKSLSFIVTCMFMVTFIVPSINVKLVTANNETVKYWKVDNHSEYLIAYNNVNNEPENINGLMLYVGSGGHIIKLYNKYLTNDGIQYVS